MKKQIFVIISVVGIILIGLGINYTRNSSGYFSFNYGPGSQDFSKKIIGNYSLHRTSANEIFITPNDGYNQEIPIVPSKVLKINNYNEYILAERQALKRRSPNNITDTYQVPDEKIKDYWILNTQKNYVLKNLSYEMFQKKLDSLNIPKKIKLVDVYNY